MTADIEARRQRLNDKGERDMAEKHTASDGKVLLFCGSEESDCDFQH